MTPSDLWLAVPYAAAGLAVWLPWLWLRRRRHVRGAAALEESRREGLMEPASLHPVIDASACIGCAACVDACPEQDVLGLVAGKAVLVAPANCIGHGACKEACPMDAIELVLGTERRGVDIPTLGDDFQTNVPGVFVAGELGGMGLIRNAVEQGRQAIESVRGFDGVGRGEGLDVVIVGAGPAGFAASLAALEAGLRFVTLEQDTLGGTVAHYPRGKIVMTAPVELPLYGKVKLRETTKEALLRLWLEVEASTGLAIRYEERVVAVRRAEGGFEVETTKGGYHTRTVVLAIGRRGTPRKLDVPGEDSEKVVYRLTDPEQYRGRRVLVVGGGDSALEAATELAGIAAGPVVLSYRGDAFSRAKPKNRAKLDAARARRQVDVFLSSEVVEIGADRVRIAAGGCEREIANDTVIVCAGGILPTAFLQSIGVGIETKFGTA
jgi:thioredoxin reductase/Pyruvate/2-oxoacid:ferredoxin oxidoreductase delta subunit